METPHSDNPVSQDLGPIDLNLLRKRSAIWLNYNPAGPIIMSFILVPNHGDDLQVNAWNWRPTLEFLHAEKVIDAETYELMGCQGCGGKADADLARIIAVTIDCKLQTMHPGERIRGDLSITSKPKKVVYFESSSPIDAVDLYSATYEWLIMFRDFCRNSEGFKVV